MKENCLSSYDVMLFRNKEETFNYSITSILALNHMFYDSGFVALIATSSSFSGEKIHPQEHTVSQSTNISFPFRSVLFFLF